MAKRSRYRRRWRGWADFPERRSAIAADGIKAKARAGKKFGQTWWGGKWIAALERLVDPGRLSRGRTYARKGQVLSIDFDGAAVNARVQGSRPAPYRVTIRVSPIDERGWNRAFDEMASQAIFAARLLAGEMPEDIESAFQAAGVALFPDRGSDLATVCSCPDWANPCKHVSAVYYLLSERFDDDPFLLFQLRGRTRDQTVTELRLKRGATTETSESSTPRGDLPDLPDDLAPLPSFAELCDDGPLTVERCLADFWHGDADWTGVEFSLRRPEIDAIPIRRLGRPPFGEAEGRQFVETISDAYHTISEAAISKTLLE